MANVLWNLERVEEAISVCRAATAQDPYDESCHLLLMQLLMASGAKQMAAQYYSDVANLLRLQLGIEPSEEMTALYHQLSGGERGSGMEMDVRTVLSGLQDQNRGSGAFFCDYSVFREIYSLLVRSALRSGQVVQMSLLTVLDLDGEFLSPGRRPAAMEELRTAIANCCRSGDVCSQYGVCQYLLLLPTASYENGNKAIERVLSSYQRTMLGMTTMVKCSTISALSTEQRMPKAPARNTWQWKVMKN